MFVWFVLLCSVQKKFRTFRQKVHWVFSPQRRAPRSPRSLLLASRNKRSRAYLHSVRSQNKFSALRAGKKAKKVKGEKKSSRSSVFGLLRDEWKKKSQHERISEPTHQNSHDDIDDIFASMGLWHSVTSSLQDKREFVVKKITISERIFENSDLNCCTILPSSGDEKKLHFLVIYSC